MGAIRSLSTIFKGGQVPKPVRGYIIPLSPQNADAPVMGEAKAFQYFPETIQDARQVNYQNRQIPGLSHPLYSWISGGSREINFSAVFTRDRTLSDDGLVRVQRDAYGTSGALANIQQDQNNVDIPSAVAWLRSFMYPELFAKDDAKNLNNFLALGGYASRPFPPRKLILGLPGLRLNVGSFLPMHEIVCFMQTCDVSYESFFANGTPRIARVQLGFVEIVQWANKVALHGSGNLRARSLYGYNRDLKTANVRGDTSSEPSFARSARNLADQSSGYRGAGGNF